MSGRSHDGRRTNRLFQRRESRREIGLEQSHNRGRVCRRRGSELSATIKKSCRDMGPEQFCHVSTNNFHQLMSANYRTKSNYRLNLPLFHESIFPYQVFENILQLLADLVTKSPETHSPEKQASFCPFFTIFHGKLVKNLARPFFNKV